MNERTAGSEGRDEAAGTGGETADERTRRERLADAVNALRESIDEMIAGLLGRGDAGEGKARELLRTATERARAATADAREKFDFVTHDRFDELSARVARLEARMAERVAGSGGGDEEDSRPR